MSTGAVEAESPALVRFQRNLPFLNPAGSLGIQVTADRGGDVLSALLSSEKPFPNREIELGEIKASAETSKPIEFGTGSLRASFSAQGSAFAGIGVYRDPAKVRTKLAVDNTLLPGLNLAAGPGDNLLLLRWGFDAAANLSGAVALGAAGKATAKVEAATEGLFAAVRRLSQATPARAALQELADSWMLPRQVDSLDDLAPGTWLVAEVDGRVGLKLGVQAGWDFSWVRETKLGGLQGDIGLRLEAALGATFGFRAEGRWAVVVAREAHAPELRLRLFRLKARQLDLALSAGAVFTPVQAILPRKVDDLIKAVFGTHGAQVLGYVAVVEKWTDPSKKLTELLANEGIDQAKRLIAHVAGIPEDQLDDRFNEIQQRVVGLIKAWRDLDHRVATMIMRLVGEKVDLATPKAILNQLRNIDADSLKKLLEEHLPIPDFLTTPAGRLLESVGVNGVLTILSRPIAEIREIASQALKLLDGSLIEESLGRLQDYLEKQFNIGKILDTITETDFNKLDGLLKQKLAEFLGESSIDFAKLEQIRGAIRMVLDKRQEWYEKALRAIERSYTAQLTASFEKSVEDQAHLDVIFDFRNDPTGVAALLKAALSGDFDEVLTRPHRDVRLGLATLSHGVKRRSHVEITLPYFKAHQTHLNQALATVSAKDDSGRVLVYTLDAHDTVLTNRRNSTLAVAMDLVAPGQGGALRLHHEGGLTYSYTLRQAMKRATRADLSGQMGTLFRTYLPQKPLDKFLDYFDARTEEVIPQTPDFIGNTMINLQVSLPAAVARFAGSAWLSAPSDKDERLKRKQAMSLSIQRRMRELIEDNYFQSAERYGDLRTAYLLLAWASLHPFNKPGGVFWNWPDIDLRRSRLSEQTTRMSFENRFGAIHARLRTTPGMAGTAEFYRREDAATRLGEVDADSPLLRGLLFSQAVIMDEAAKAYDAIAEMGAEARTRPSRAIEHLTDFGSKLTEAFNQEVSSTFLGGTSRALGTALYLAATMALAGREGALPANALLTISAMKSDAAFEPEAFLDNGLLPADKIAAQEQLVALA